MKKYKTIHKIATTEIVEKKSKFIGNVCPVDSEKMAIDFISQIRKKHYNATHNCFAYVVQEKMEIARFSDDGEPNGTAGKPILDVLFGEEIKNAVIVVTRYFGGTLLGTGGLVRAYGKTAKQSVLEAGIVQMDTYNMIQIVSDYNLSGKVQYEISINGHIIIDTKYTENVQYDIYVHTDLADKFIKHIVNITNNKVKIQKKDVYFLKIVDGQVCAKE